MEIDSITQLPEISNSDERRRRRRVFYGELLEHENSGPTDDLRRLGKHWKECLGGDWVWIWIYHPPIDSIAPSSSGRWELTSVYCDSGSEPIPSKLTPTDGASAVAELGRKTGQSIFVRDVESWEITHENCDYRVVCVSDLVSLGCRSLVCVPCILPSRQKESKVGLARAREPIVAAVCVHFKQQPKFELEGQHSLKLMAKLSGKIIRDSYEHQQQQVLAEMNALAVKYLARMDNTRPAVNRKEYLQEVIEISCEKLHVKYASIYYRDERKGDIIYCLATNSLFDRTGKDLSKYENLFRNAVYSPGEGITGAVFQSGIPYMSGIGDKPIRGSYKFRETPMERDEGDLAWVVYPILEPSQNSNVKKQVLGVIRCVDTTTGLVPGVSRNIDTLQLSTLNLIANTLAPVLETSALSIRRANRVSVIKHDLAAPLQMAHSLAKEAEEWVVSGKVPREHFAGDLQFCIFSASGLAADLDRSSIKVEQFRPKKLKMEADIVARIKNMLASFAKTEADMIILAGNIKGVFPEYVLVDDNLIMRCLSNLILNAIKYGDPGTSIWIQPRSDDECYHLVVENSVGKDGLALSDDEISNIFTEGFRTPGARKKKIGRGLGLAISKSIMERHSGSLSCRASAEKSAFWMSFPKSIAVSVDTDGS